MIITTFHGCDKYEIVSVQFILTIFSAKSFNYQLNRFLVVTYLRIERKNILFLNTINVIINDIAQKVVLN